MAHFLPLPPNESHKEQEASIFQRSRQAHCKISFDEAHQRGFVLPGCHSNGMCIQEARKLDTGRLKSALQVVFSGEISWNDSAQGKLFETHRFGRF